MDHATYSALKAIQSRDPDGMPDEPTAARQDAFQRWAIAAYGVEVWRRYAAGNWAPEPDV